MNDKVKERWPEMDIRFLVLEADTFIVCIDSELDVDWSTNDGFQGLNDETRHHEILNRTALLESLPIYSLPEQIRLSYKRMLGEAIARSLSDDYPNAIKALDSAEGFINARNGELARFWYLTAGGAYAIIIAIAGLLLWFGRHEVKGLLGNTLFWLAIAAVAGAVGALFSIIMRMGKSSLDCSAGKGLHQLESVSRITAGMISAMLIALAIYADFIFSAFTKFSNKQIVIVLAALIAGASERWAPSLIEHVEKQGAQTGKRKGTV